MQIHLTWNDVQNMASALAPVIMDHVYPGQKLSLYGVPRGGTNVAQLLLPVLKASGAACGVSVEMANLPHDANVIVDDVVASGKTKADYTRAFKAAFFSLVPEEANKKNWYVFPWEGDESDGPTENVRRLLQFIEGNKGRPGTDETPDRVIKAYGTWFSGYAQDPAAILKTFEDGAEGTEEMVVETNIPVYSHCEHHMAPFFGVAHVGYIPNGKIVGLSKLVRLVDVFARRLQVQERLTCQIADALNTELAPLGVGVVIECRHMCMESRGVKTPGVTTTTSALRGHMKDEPETRAEFLALARARAVSP